MPTGILEVTVVEGRSLKDQDLTRKSNTFIEVYLHSKDKQRTATVSGNNDPVWNERFKFDIHAGDDFIFFDVYDINADGIEAIGSAKAKLKNVFDSGTVDEWIKLPAHHGISTHAEIHAVMNFTVSMLIVAYHSSPIALIFILAFLNTNYHQQLLLVFLFLSLKNDYFAID